MAATGKTSLNTDDVAELFTRVLGHVITRKTVREYVRLSKPVSDPAKKPGRYVARPIPMPDNVDGRLQWRPAKGETMAGLKKRLTKWVVGRDGQGAGGGRPVGYRPPARQITDSPPRPGGLSRAERVELQSKLDQAER